VRNGLRRLPEFSAFEHIGIRRIDVQDPGLRLEWQRTRDSLQLDIFVNPNLGALVEFELQWRRKSMSGKIMNFLTAAHEGKTICTLPLGLRPKPVPVAPPESGKNRPLILEEKSTFRLASVEFRVVRGHEAVEAAIAERVEQLSAETIEALDRQMARDKRQWNERRLRGEKPRYAEKVKARIRRYMFSATPEELSRAIVDADAGAAVVDDQDQTLDITPRSFVSNGILKYLAGTPRWRDEGITRSVRHDLGERTSDALLTTVEIGPDGTGLRRARPPGSRDLADGATVRVPLAESFATFGRAADAELEGVYAKDKDLEEMGLLGPTRRQFDFGLGMEIDGSGQGPNEGYGVCDADIFGSLWIGLAGEALLSRFLDPLIAHFTEVLPKSFVGRLARSPCLQAALADPEAAASIPEEGTSGGLLVEIDPETGALRASADVSELPRWICDFVRPEEAGGAGDCLPPGLSASIRFRGAAAQDAPGPAQPSPLPRGGAPQRGSSIPRTASSDEGRSAGGPDALGGATTRDCACRAAGTVGQSPQLCLSADDDLDGFLQSVLNGALTKRTDRSTLSLTAFTADARRLASALAASISETRGDPTPPGKAGAVPCPQTGAPREALDAPCNPDWDFFPSRLNLLGLKGVWDVGAASEVPSTATRFSASRSHLTRLLPHDAAARLCRRATADAEARDAPEAPPRSPVPRSPVPRSPGKSFPPPKRATGNERFTALASTQSPTRGIEADRQKHQNVAKFRGDGGGAPPGAANAAELVGPSSPRKAPATSDRPSRNLARTGALRRSVADQGVDDVARSAPWAPSTVGEALPGISLLPTGGLASIPLNHVLPLGLNGLLGLKSVTLLGVSLRRFDFTAAVRYDEHTSTLSFGVEANEPTMADAGHNACVACLERGGRFCLQDPAGAEATESRSYASVGWCSDESPMRGSASAECPRELQLEAENVGSCPSFPLRANVVLSVDVEDTSLLGAVNGIRAFGGQRSLQFPLAIEVDVPFSAGEELAGFKFSLDSGAEESSPYEKAPGEPTTGESVAGEPGAGKPKPDADKGEVLWKGRVFDCRKCTFRKCCGRNLWSSQRKACHHCACLARLELVNVKGRWRARGNSIPWLLPPYGSACTFEYPKLCTLFEHRRVIYESTRL
jgi:hypothetical protein